MRPEDASENPKHLLVFQTKNLSGVSTAPDHTFHDFYANILQAHLKKILRSQAHKKLSTPGAPTQVPKPKIPL
jgi:hypothetical protein